MPPKLHLHVLLGKQVDVILAGQIKKWWEHFPMHEIRKINGGRRF
jgi:hypothetical protein